jgi:hypothetical protein
MVARDPEGVGRGERRDILLAIIPFVDRAGER